MMKPGRPSAEDRKIIPLPVVDRVSPPDNLTAKKRTLFREISAWKISQTNYELEIGGYWLSLTGFGSLHLSSICGRSVVHVASSLRWVDSAFSV